MENTILEPIEKKADLHIDEEVFFPIMERYVKEVWKFYQQNNESEELREYLNKEPLELSNYMVEVCVDKIKSDDDIKDLQIITNEITIAMVQILRQVSENTRNEYWEIFVNNED